MLIKLYTSSLIFDQCSTYVETRSDILPKDAGRLFHGCFSNILLVKANYLAYP